MIYLSLFLIAAEIIFIYLAVKKKRIKNEEIIIFGNNEVLNKDIKPVVEKREISRLKPTNIVSKKKILKLYNLVERYKRGVHGFSHTNF